MLKIQTSQCDTMLKVCDNCLIAEKNDKGFVAFYDNHKRQEITEKRLES